MSFFLKHFWGRDREFLHWYFCQQLSCVNLHSSGSIGLLFLIIFGRVQDTQDLGLKSFQMQCLCTCSVSVKKPKQKTCWKPFYFYPGAKFNLFMQLAVVLETELELYLHINILIAGRILGLKTVRADRVRVQNNGRIIVFLPLLSLLAQICKCCDIPQCFSACLAAVPCLWKCIFKTHLSLHNNKGHKNSDTHTHTKKKNLK